MKRKSRFLISVLLAFMLATTLSFATGSVMVAFAGETGDLYGQSDQIDPEDPTVPEDPEQPDPDILAPELPDPEQPEPALEVPAPAPEQPAAPPAAPAPAPKTDKSINKAKAAPAGSTAAPASSSPQYELTKIGEEHVPLSNIDASGTVVPDCCSLHMILMLAALAAFAVYVWDTKRQQKRIQELEAELVEYDDSII